MRMIAAVRDFLKFLFGMSRTEQDQPQHSIKTPGLADIEAEPTPPQPHSVTSGNTPASTFNFQFHPRRVHLVRRNVVTGRFVSAAYAKRYPHLTVSETVYT